MNTVLLSAGAACVIAAVVGGGLKAFNIEVPVVSSLLRQALLFVVGAAFLVSAWVLRAPVEHQDDQDGATSTYHQLVAATCTRIVSIRAADLPLDVIDVSSSGVRFRKIPLVNELRRRQSAMQAELESLWAHTPPAGLTSQQSLAEQFTATWLGRFSDQIRALKATASDLVSQEDANVLENSGDAAIRARVNDAMTTLAGQNCPAAG
jgi:hypothetical protein